MEVFKWDQNLETGITLVDQQHRHLVQVINRFGDTLAQNRLDSDAINAVFSELTAYARSHFNAEEQFMTAVAIAPAYIDLHKEEHRSFLQDVSLMHRELTVGKELSARHLFEYLVNWLIYHILGSDMSMSRQSAAIQQQVDPADAYRAEIQTVDNSTGLLLQSLNTLFHQVSSRNKQLIDLNQSLEERVERRTEELSNANRRLDELASTDVLTGLHNRRFAFQTLDQLWLESLSKELPLACMMIDADGFKQINDTCGHDAGDLVLCKLAKRLTFAVRTDDIVCRMGGDEFLIILPNTDHDGAMQVARHTQEQVAKLTVAVVGGSWQGSVSIGVAVKTKAMQNPKDLIKMADQSVYAAKSAGKNCVRQLA